MTELAIEWRPIAGFPGYEVGSNGEIRSWHLDRTTPREEQALPRVLVGSFDKYGYRRVTLRGPAGKRGFYTHHALVIRAFVGPKPFPKAVTRHRDGNKLNNAAANLLWGTQAENIADRERHGNTRRGETHHNSMLTLDQVRRIRELHGTRTYKAIAAEFGVSASTISNIVSGRQWREAVGA